MGEETFASSAGPQVSRSLRCIIFASSGRGLFKKQLQSCSAALVSGVRNTLHFFFHPRFFPESTLFLRHCTVCPCKAWKSVVYVFPFHRRRVARDAFGDFSGKKKNNKDFLSLGQCCATVFPLPWQPGCQWLGEQTDGSSKAGDKSRSYHRVIKNSQD